MNKYLKLLTTVMILMVLVVPAIKADINIPEDSFAITSVTVEGVEFDENDISSGDDLIYAPVYLDSELEVKVEWEAGDSVTDDELEAKIEVEFDGDEVDTDYFDIESNWHGSKTLTVKIDNDEDLLGEEVLNVRMRSRDGDYEDMVRIYLDVSREKHLVDLFDVNFRQGVQYGAGDLLTASVGVVNDGREEEEDIYVRMSIPELGLTTRSDRFDLVSEEDEDVDDEDYYKLHKTLFLELPANTPAGVYDLVVEAVFNDGDDKVEKVYSIVVGAGASGSQITMDTQTQTVEAGKAIVYKVLFGATNVDYDVEVTGLDFGTYEVRKEADTAFVFVSVDEDTPAGTYDFNVNVKAGNSVVQSFDVTTVVAGAQGASYSDVKQGLEIGFAVLLVILVILGIILVAKKLGKGDEIEEPALDEEQTYY